MKLAIIIPAYNESLGITKCLNKVFKSIQRIKVPTTVFVINDGSMDNTLEVLKHAKKIYKSKLNILTYRQNKGYGFAITTGIKTAIKYNFTYALIMDSDLTNNPKYIPQFFKKIEEGYDCVKGSRYIYGGHANTVPINRRLPSLIGNFFAGMFFCLGIHDYTNGFRIIRLSKLKNVKFIETGFAHILEEVYLLKKNGGAFSEIPVTLTVRKDGKSKFKYNLATFRSYIRYPVKVLIDNIYGKPN